MKGSTARALAAAIALLLTLFLPPLARAHTVGVSRCDLSYDPGGAVTGTLVFSRADALAVGRMDANHDGIVTEDEARASEARFASFVSRGVLVSADGVRCTGGLQGGGDVEEDGFGLSLAFTCPANAHTLRADLLFVVELPAGHRTVARWVGGGASVDRTLSIDDRQIELDLPGPRAAASRPADDSTSEGRFWPPLVGALRLGIEHILTGWDHLLFVLALLLGVSRAKPLALAVSAFTVAHSLTLACAALGIFAPSPRVIEPLVGVSIAAVAWEAARHVEATHPERLTLLFGLIHGFAFASGLHALALDRARLAPVLLGFNVGVEVGQLAVVAIAFPLLTWLRRGGLLTPSRTRRAAWALGAVGLAIALVRVTQPG